MDLKETFSHYIRYQLPRVLTQVDRDPDSPTYGCFDRNYWHYKIRDFPSSILQQGVFALDILAGEGWFDQQQREAIATWSVAAINALARQSDGRGRVDEYYPFEASYPAAAFGLYGACKVLVDWQAIAPERCQAIDNEGLSRLSLQIARRRETQAINQQAAGLAGLALAVKLGLIEPHLAQIEACATQLLQAQHPEGWFDEYGGADFGYLSVTLDALVDYYEVTGDDRATQAIDRALNFLVQMVGADGCLPSTLNSRNTDYVVPYGLVRSASRNAQASWLVETLFANAAQETHFLWATDDRYHCHYLFASVIRSLPHLESMLPAEVPETKDSVYLQGCGLWIYWSSDRAWNAYIAGRKGGLIRIHRRQNTPLVDFGWRIATRDRLWTSNWQSQHWQIQLEKDTISIQGRCQRVRYHVTNPYKHLLLRILAFVLREKLIPLLKQIAIFRPGNTDGPQFKRTVKISDRGIEISDRVGEFRGAIARPSPRQNLRHVASADSFSFEEWLTPLICVPPQNLTQPVEIEANWYSEETAIGRELGTQKK